MTARPDRPYVAAIYDLGAEVYDALWSPVILPAAQQVVAELGLTSRSRILDVGTGTGALVPTFRTTAPGATVVGVDAAIEMLRLARAQDGAAVLQGDAAALPMPDASVDAALLAFVLFHLSDPAAAVAEAARVLRDGGRAGTVTWASESSPQAFEVWDATLRDGGAAPLPAPRSDSGLNDVDGIEALLTAAGLTSTRIWVSALSHQWEPSTYWRLATGSGLNRKRLEALDAPVRAEVLQTARSRLSALEGKAYRWSGKVISAVAIRPPRR